MKRRESIKQMLINLTFVLPQANIYAKSDGRYKELLVFLNSKNYYLNDELPIPSFKEISVETGLTVDKLRKQIKNLYLGLVDSFNGFSFDFGKTEVIFTAEFLKNYASFKTNNIKFIPRVGENIEIPFFKAKIGISMFYVKDVRHSFINNQQIIDIRLHSGLYNKYSHFRLDKALATGEVGRLELYNSSEFEIMNRLGITS